MSKKDYGFVDVNAVIALGEMTASILASCYSSETANDKLKAVCDITMLNISEEARLFFIKDIISRPKIQRLAASRKILEILEK